MAKADNDRTARLEGRNGDVWKAYLSGQTQCALAEKYGVTQARISQIIRDVRLSIPEETTDDLRMLDLERLDAVLPAHYRAAKAGDKDGLTGVLKIMERRARLLGMDAPVKQNVTAAVRYEVVGLDEDDASA